MACPSISFLGWVQYSPGPQRRVDQRESSGQRRAKPGTAIPYPCSCSPSQPIFSTSFIITYADMTNRLPRRFAKTNSRTCVGCRAKLYSKQQQLGYIGLQVLGIIKESNISGMRYCPNIYLKLGIR